MKINKYDYLPKGARQIREDVFGKEQGFTDEFDAIDDISVHLLACEDLMPVATCRYYWSKDKNSYVIGRIAVAKDFRGKEIGAKILQEAERNIRIAGGQKVCLAAQVKAAGFYKKQGYCSVGVVFDDEDCPHIWMQKSFEVSNKKTKIRN